jgi:hypothetical protein
MSETFGLTINRPAGELSSVAVSPASFASGQTGSATVRLTTGAPGGGSVVSLSSSDAAAASVPASVTVPHGAKSATFQVAAGTVSAATLVTLTASYSGVSETASVTITPATGSASH